MASGKKLVNTAEDAVTESLEGFTRAYPHLEYHASKRVVLVPNWRDRSGKVAIVSGGGGGHEPWAAGFVGTGLLTASIAGSIFAAPPSNNILHALHCVSTNNTAGIFVIVPNYTGDCLNFGIAIEKTRNEGATVAELTVGEDCSIPTSELGRAGKRGLIGLLFVAKVTGALAERGQSLQSVAQCAEIVTNNIATYAVGLNACALPGQEPMFEVPADQLELGLGIHGEAGYKRVQLDTAHNVVSLVLDRIIAALSLINGESVAVIVNNFGATSQLEQGIVVNEVVKQLESRGLHPLRVYAGVLMTSLNGAGIQVSILRLADHCETSLISCLDEETSAPCWPGTAYSLPCLHKRYPVEDHKRRRITKVGPVLNEKAESLLRQCLQNACSIIIENESKINELDGGCGDGDCGSTMRQLAEGICSSLDSLPLSYPSSTLTGLSVIAEESMGGTSGAIYSLMFTTAAAELALADNKELWPLSWAHAWRGGIEGIMRYSKAKLGDRTMLDALEPACSQFEDNLSKSYNEALIKAAEGARSGCDATKNMQAMAGRASYVKQTMYLQNVDAGAFAVSLWINAVTATILDAWE